MLLIWRKAVYEGGCSELDIKEQRMVFLVHIVPKLVVKTKRVEQVMKLGFLNLDKNLSSTSIEIVTKGESH